MGSSYVVPILGVRYPVGKCEFFDKLRLFSQVSSGGVSVRKDGLARVMFGIEPFDVGFARDGNKLKLISYSPNGLKRVYKTLCRRGPCAEHLYKSTAHSYNTSASRFRPSAGTEHDYVISARFVKNCTNDSRYRVIQVVLSLAYASLRHVDVDTYRRSVIPLLAFDALVEVVDEQDN